MALKGQNTVGVSATGSGKTLAFLLPAMIHINAQQYLKPGEGPIVLVLAPTRELAVQIKEECDKFGASSEIKNTVVYGGVPKHKQVRTLREGIEIVIATPGRLIDHLEQGNTNLRRITYLVLDEADRMFDMGFEPQVMRVLDNCRPDRQTVMFSATFPRQMEGLARRILIKPVEVQVGGRSVVSNEIEQNVNVLEDDAKFLKLLELLGKYVEDGACLVFVDKQEHADALLKDLMNHGYNSCASLHGGIDQYDRDSTITRFKQGKVQILVATS